ncbi:MAG TPA: SusE domain-containing protein [Bacteroidales bacterium]|nr:SusE domain-containing protein [Bacteroidales bacterium]
MKVKSFIIIAFAGLLGLVSCKKDEDKQVLSDNPTAPTLNIPSPDLVLLKTNANDTITFNGNAADFGVNVVITYALEADTSASFTHPVTLASGTVNKFEFNIADFNTKIVDMGIAEFAQANIKFRVNASVSTYTPSAYSNVSTMNITTFGASKLVLSTNPEQSLSSPAGNGIYSGWVYIDSTSTSFTLTNTETGVVYGGSAGTLVPNGTAITAAVGGYNVTVNLNDNTYTMTDATLAIIGDATGSWADDQKMVYDFTEECWKITMDLVVGANNGTIKFRTHGGWNGEFNLGIGDASHPEYTIDNLWNSSSSQNIPVPGVPGNFTVKLWANKAPYHCTITQNSKK